MEFYDKYTSMTEKEKDKKIISDDYFALCEMINNLIKQLEKNRKTL